MSYCGCRSFFDRCLTTGFFAGYSPVAPGTAGTLVGLMIWMAAGVFLSPCTLQIVTLWLLCLMALGSVKPIMRLEKEWGRDPSKVVVDEMIGIWVCLCAVPSDIVFFSTRYLTFVALAFILFRLFDIWKPLGVRMMEKIGGGWGVIMDDVLAGCYVVVIMMTCRYFGL